MSQPTALIKVESVSADRASGTSVLERVAEHGTEVVVLGLQPVEPDGGARGAQLGLGELPELEEIRGAPAPDVLRVAALVEPLERELADRLQHPEAAVREADEALVDQRLQCVQ